MQVSYLIELCFEAGLVLCPDTHAFETVVDATDGAWTRSGPPSYVDASVHVDLGTCSGYDLTDLLGSFTL